MTASRVRNLLLALCWGLWLLLAAASYAASWAPVPRMESVPLPLPRAEAPARAWSEAEVGCLARTIYGEARDQPVEGQVAVAAVVVARSLHPKWPKDLCAVVTQRGQFAGYRSTVRCPNRIECAAYAKAVEVARMTTEGFYRLPKQYQRVYYFHEGTQPRFSQWAKVEGRIGHHIFYTLKT